MAAIIITLPAVDLPGTQIPSPAGKLVSPEIHLPERKMTADHDQLRDLMAAARDAAGRAYAPFSNFPVGASVIMADDEDGRIHTGCNVENSSFGGTICAERNAIFTAATIGFRRIRFLAVSTVRTLDATIADRSPCGICRQVIREFADPETLILIDSGDDGTLAEIFDIDRLLPFGFGFSGKNGIP